MPAEHEERAVYVVHGELAALAPGMQIRLRADGKASARLLGGNRFPAPRHIGWNSGAGRNEIHPAAFRMTRSDSIDPP
ncbi:MAG: hypothetical protein ABI356_03025 [Steroidobacteraceae bacterium]